MVNFQKDSLDELQTHAESIDPSVAARVARLIEDLRANAGASEYLTRNSIAMACTSGEREHGTPQRVFIQGRVAPLNTYYSGPRSRGGNMSIADMAAASRAEDALFEAEEAARKAREGGESTTES